MPDSEIHQEVPGWAPGFDLSLHQLLLAMPGREEEARSFYRDVLGLQEVDKPPVLRGRGGAWFRGPALEVHPGVELEFRAARKAHQGILADGLEGLAARLTEGRVEISWDTDFPGSRRFYAHDPFGNRLEFLQSETSDPPPQLG